MREHLPDERAGVVHHFEISYFDELTSQPKQLDGYIRTSCYADGRLGEVFLTIGKPGSDSAWGDQWALGASMALQGGVDVDAYFFKFVGQRFGVCGPTRNPKIPRCTSILDYVARWIIGRYGSEAGRARLAEMVRRVVEEQVK